MVLASTSRPRLARRHSSRPRSSTAEVPWHAADVAQVLARLGSGHTGLDPRDAAARLSQLGPNQVEGERERSRLEILLSQVANLPSALLLGSAAISTALRELVDAGAIAAVVGLNAAIGYEVERESEELLASWKKLEAGTAMVVRGGRLATVPAVELVPGDVILCRAGDLLPADARLFETHRLACNEASLTGESEMRQKSPLPVGAAAPLAERDCMLYAGTQVVAGHGRAVVVATGVATEVARVRQSWNEEKTPASPLSRRTAELANRFALFGVAAGAASAGLALLRGQPLRDVLGNAVALGVAAIPEGLPVVTTAALVRSMQRMRRRGMVVRRLSAAETLGGVSVICADKTGTLTQNTMRAEVVDIGGRSTPIEGLRARPDRLFTHGPTLALAAAVLNSDVDVQQDVEEKTVAGSSTEAALVRAAWGAGLSRSALRRLYPRRRLIERSDGTSYVVSVHDSASGGICFVKGAPEQVVSLCARDLRGPLSPSRRRAVLRRNEALAADGLRVLAVAWRRVGRERATRLDRGYTLIGLIGLRDPLREGAAEAVREARRAGIRTLILTGDQRRTAEAVARAVGLEGDTIEGAEAMRLLSRGDGAWLERVAAVARITPADKVRMVGALRARGHVVAMAGDGINDAPALKAADVGIAVGVRSDDLARHSAQVVLETEDLRSILAAVGEGRVVQDNLRRAAGYLLATNAAEILYVLGGAAAGARTPLNSRQILWINLLSDTLPALALALEPGEGDVLARPPAALEGPLLDAAALRRIGRDAALLAAAAGVGHLLGGPPAAFSTLVGTELGYAAMCRAAGAPPSARFDLLVAAGAALQVAALGLPPLRWLLGLPLRPAAAEAAGFGIGLALPWLLAASASDPVIVRIGSDLAPQDDAPRTAARHIHRR